MNDTKKRILAAAEELLSQKGAAATTISEIAKKAKVADSHAYQYFKGKEGLVFSIAEKRLKATLSDYKEQLAGIQDPKSKLSKFIWYGLRYNDTHQDYVRNLVFDYRSNLEFYNSPAYKLVQKHAEICGAILKEGVEKGHFRDDVNLYLVREIIYGTIDAQSMSCVLTKEIEKITDDWEEIISLIFRMLEPAPPSTRSKSKQQKIIEAAEQVFAEFGFDKAKISKIAMQAGVAEGSIYDYFKNKEGLLFSISKMRIDNLDKIMKDSFVIKEPAQKLRRFLKLHFSIFARNRNFLKIFVFDTLLNRNFYNSEAHVIYKNYQTRFLKIIDEGIKKGAFRPDLNARLFKDMFLGTCMHMALRWIIFPNKPFDKLHEIDTITDMFTSVALNRESIES
jgi:TetR/AcrR family fatty acid metabolism transcriptional regulator